MDIIASLLKRTLTGPRVISKHISVASIKAVNAVLRRPVTLWDNFHANDYDQRRIFLGNKYFKTFSVPSYLLLF